MAGGRPFLSLFLLFFTFLEAGKAELRDQSLVDDLNNSIRTSRNSDSIMPSEKRVLVTGGAGFIGYHVTREMALKFNYLQLLNHRYNHNSHHNHHSDYEVRAGVENSFQTIQQEQKIEFTNYYKQQGQQNLKRQQQTGQNNRKGRKNGVVVIDNFNDFYDVNLKRDRAYELHRLGVTVHKADLCNSTFLKDLMARHDFTHVVHLAAQASVRFSLNSPNSYVTANIQCYLVLLETLKLFPSVKLVYASSSSVYSETGDVSQRQPQRFHLTSDTDHPSNLYAATKRTTEVLSDVYCRTSGLQTIGLRFFTVYGPWGRPDMAVYKFALSIWKGEELPMFTAKDNSTLSRDFTYIEDVTNGVLLAMDYKPKQCGKRFNIGYGNPVPLSKLVELIEAELGKKANIKHLLLHPTERLRTWADIEQTRQSLNFSPRVGLEEGVQLFVEWFKRYHTHYSSNADIADKVQWFSKL